MNHLYLIRHGESEANVDPTVYYRKFDNDIVLTPTGVEQARQCGKELQSLIRDNGEFGTYGVFSSPYVRTRSTWKLMSENLTLHPSYIQYDGRLREQEFKDFTNHAEFQSKREEAAIRGKLQYRYKYGESGWDVYNRVSNFYNQFRFDLAHENLEAKNVVVAHEVAIRAFLSVALRADPEDFNVYVKNCQIIHLAAGNNLQFRLVSPKQLERSRP
jgi:broad specificity phosphatase PhoE